MFRTSRGNVFVLNTKVLEVCVKVHKTLVRKNKTITAQT